MSTAEYLREWRQRNPDKVASYTARNTQRRRESPERMDKHNASRRERDARNWGKLAAIKLAAGCVDCGYAEHAVALQFDHVRGEKLGNVASMARSSWEKVQQEIEKCEVRCANCHAIVTQERRDARGKAVLRGY